MKTFRCSPWLLLLHAHFLLLINARCIHSGMNDGEAACNEKANAGTSWIDVLPALLNTVPINLNPLNKRHSPNIATTEDTLETNLFPRAYIPIPRISRPDILSPDAFNPESNAFAPRPNPEKPENTGTGLDLNSPSSSSNEDNGSNTDVTPSPQESPSGNGNDSGNAEDNQETISQAPHSTDPSVTATATATNPSVTSTTPSSSADNGVDGPNIHGTSSTVGSSTVMANSTGSTHYTVTTPTTEATVVTSDAVSIGMVHFPAGCLIIVALLMAYL